MLFLICLLPTPEREWEASTERDGAQPISRRGGPIEGEKLSPFHGLVLAFTGIGCHHFKLQETYPVTYQSLVPGLFLFYLRLSPFFYSDLHSHFVAHREL